MLKALFWDPFARSPQSNFPLKLEPFGLSAIDLLFIGTFKDQSMSIGCVSKLGITYWNKKIQIITCMALFWDPFACSPQSNFPFKLEPFGLSAIDLSFMGTFKDQSMSIGYVSKLGITYWNKKNTNNHLCGILKFFQYMPHMIIKLNSLLLSHVVQWDNHN